jgi:hypothetical protein
MHFWRSGTIFFAVLQLFFEFDTDQVQICPDTRGAWPVTDELNEILQYREVQA